MKIKGLLLFFAFGFVFFSCESPTKETVNSSSQKKEAEQIFRQKEEINKKPLLDSLAAVNKNFKNLIHNFSDTIYTIDLLKDKTKQNLSYIHPLTFRHKQSILDTPSVKSRLVLTNMHLKKLNYLINKKQIDSDSIEKTLNKIVLDINKIVDIAEKYKNQKDEFLEILQFDSIANDTLKRNSLNLQKK